MNHRELVLSARKKARFHFLQLPESLQDEVIESLDGQALTLEAARDFLAGRGHVLSHEAIAAYYRAVRRERRLHDSTQELTRVFEEFRGQDLESNVKAFSLFAIARATSLMADGEVGFRDIDLGKVISGMAALAKEKKAEGGMREAEGGGRKAEGERSVPDAATLKRLREQMGL
jgi:hypothetical protein